MDNTKGEIAQFLNISTTELDKQLKLFATTTESNLTYERQYITKLRNVIIQKHAKEIAQLKN